jgi:hypothetical protein
MGSAHGLQHTLERRTMRRITIVLALVLAGLVIGGWHWKAHALGLDELSALAPPIGGCHYIPGTSNSENITGTSKCDWIEARGGSDVLHGQGTGDWLYGEQGSDGVWGEDGNDYVGAGCRGSTCNAGSSNALHGGAGNDTLGARNGKAGDVLDCGGGTDHAWYDVGIDTVQADCEKRN